MSRPEIGATGIEIATGGQSSAPHLRIDELLGDAAKRSEFAAAFDRRGLRIAALNCSAWPLHPAVGDEHVALIRSTIRLAAELGVTQARLDVGLPGRRTRRHRPSTSPGTPGRRTSVALLERQWATAIDLWQDLAEDARQAGIERIAFELHPLHLVYNVPTFQRMRDAVGPMIGVNLDPSHLFWQQMDPLAVIRALGPAVHHVHLKDTAAPARPGGDRGRPRPAPVRRPGQSGLGLPDGRERPRRRRSGRRSWPRCGRSATTTCSRSRTRTRG